MKYVIISLMLLTFMINKADAWSSKWRRGILTDEFIYTNAPYLSCHAATNAKTPAGLVAAWFGGTNEHIFVKKLAGIKEYDELNQNTTVRKILNQFTIIVRKVYYFAWKTFVFHLSITVSPEMV